MSILENLSKLEALDTALTEKQMKACFLDLQKWSNPGYWMSVLQKYYDFPIEEWKENGNRSSGPVFTIGACLMIQRLSTIFSLSEKLNEYDATPEIPENQQRRDSLVFDTQRSFKNLADSLMNQTTLHDREILVIYFNI